MQAVQRTGRSTVLAGQSTVGLAEQDAQLGLVAMELAVGVALGVGFLFVFYRAVQLQWPESYFGASDISAYAISASPVRYVAFRFLPVYVACLFVAVSVDRSGGSGLLAAVLVGVGHASMTVGWALLVWFRSAPALRRHRVPIAILRTVVFLGVVSSSLAAAATRRLLAPLVPRVQELSATLWTALLAGIVGAFVVRVSRGASVTEYELVEQSARSIPRPLWQLAQQTAAEHGVDSKLVLAAMVVENIQRPAWFRDLERIKAAFLKRVYAAKRGERPLIRAAGGVCHSTPQ